MILGSCGRCGGPIMLGDAWYCVLPEKPRCGVCHAETVGGYGPTIAVVPARQSVTSLDELVKLTKGDPRAN